MSHIAALLSGGVDSASALCKYIKDHPERQKHIVAYYLKIWLEDELSFLGDCPWEEDLLYVEKTTQMFGIPLKIIPLQQEYREHIVHYTLEELRRGGTPSPDVFCNKKIKFGIFLNTVDADLTISGHYAQLQRQNTGGEVKLLTASDTVKDQTYFLSHLSQQQLQNICFPIGSMTKQTVRSFADQHSLPPKNRKDSQGICFLGKIKYRDFVSYHLGQKEGKIVNLDDGKILGKHLGVWFYTVGQRSGLGLGGGPWFVCKKSVEENTVWVRHLNYKEKQNKVKIEDIHWITTSPTEVKNNTYFDCNIKLRHGPQFVDSTLKYEEKTNTAELYLKQGDAGIAPGQIAVLYKDRECLGCGRIVEGY